MPFLREPVSAKLVGKFEGASLQRSNDRHRRDALRDRVGGGLEPRRGSGPEGVDYQDVDRRPLAASPQVELAGILRFDDSHDVGSDKHSITLFSGDFLQNPLVD